jgi:hypothetical protein
MGIKLRNSSLKECFFLTINLVQDLLDLLLAPIAVDVNFEHADLRKGEMVTGQINRPQHTCGCRVRGMKLAGAIETAAENKKSRDSVECACDELSSARSS